MTAVETCPQCDGDGDAPVMVDGSGTCRRCGGRGKVEVAPTLTPREPWHYIRFDATPEEARAAAEAIGFNVSWMCKLVVTWAESDYGAFGLSPYFSGCSDQTASIAWHLAIDAAHYGRIALGEQR